MNTTVLRRLLEHSNALDALQVVLDNVQDLIVVMDLEGHFKLANRASKQSLLYPDAHFADRLFVDMVAPESLGDFEAMKERVLKGEAAGQCALTLLGKDGRRVLVEGTLTSEMRSGNLIGMWGFFRNVTAERAAERAKQEQITAAAHELRTPIAALRGALAALEGYDLPKAVYSVAKTSADRLLRQVQDLLDLQRFTAAKVDLQKAGLSPSDLMASALPKVERLAKDRAIEIVVDVATAERIAADRDPLIQVIVNLLAATIRLAPTGGQVRAQVAPPAAGFVRFSFSNEGDGLPPESLSTVFESPERRVAADSVRGGSTGGLALVVSRAIVEAHGGKVGVSSKAGEGLTFWFEVGSALAVGARPEMG